MFDGDFNIIFFLLGIVEFSVHLFIVISLMGLSITLKKFLTITFLLGIVLGIMRIILPNYLYGIVTTTVSIPVLAICLKEQFSKISISYLITILLVAIIDCIVAFSVLNLSSFNSFEEMSKNVEITILGRILVIAGAFVTIMVYKVLRNGNNKIGFNKISLMNSGIIFVLLMPNIALLFYYCDNKELPFWVIMLNIASIIALFFVSTYNIRKSFEYAQKEEELATQRVYNKTLQNLVDGLRTFKHDYNNTLQTLYGFIQLEDMDGLKECFAEILDESRAITALDKLNPELFKNPSLFGLVTAKYEYSKQNNVNLNFEVYGELENLDIKTYDFTRILGIFLDNAIEAATGSEKKKVNFMVSERRGKITVEISNTYSEVGLKIEEITEKGVSSKGKNRGLGLYKVEELLKKYPKIEHVTKADNGMFLQKLIIDKVVQKEYARK